MSQSVLPIAGGGLAAGFTDRVSDRGEALQTLSRLLVVAIGLSIPLSTSVSEFLIVLYAITWCVSGGWHKKWREISRNPVALLSITMFVVLAAATLYSTARRGDALHCLGKYRELLYVPLFLAAFRDARSRRHATLAYITGIVIMLASSYLDWFIAKDLGIKSWADPVVFKDRIIHNLLLANLVYLLAHEFVDRPRFRVICGALIVLALANMLFLVQGRTGYLVVAGLIPLFTTQRFGTKGLVYAAALMLICAPAVYFGSGKFRERVNATISQFRNELGSEWRRSPDPRFELYTNTFRLIKAHPWLGTGTGSFIGEYSRIADRTVIGLARDPHCEYLHFAVQTGLGGMGLFVLLLGTQWRLTNRLDAATRRIGRGYIVTIALGSVVNSLLLGFTGGLIFGFFGGLVFSPLTAEPDLSGTSEPEACLETRKVEAVAAPALRAA